MRGVWIAVTLAAGCFSKPGFSGGAGGDGGNGDAAPTCRTFGGWSQTAKVPISMMGKDESDAALDRDGSTLIYGATHRVGNDADLFFARWDPVAMTYTGETRIDAVSDSGEQDHPAWSADDSVLYVRSSFAWKMSTITNAGGVPMFGPLVPAMDLGGLPPDPGRLRFSDDGHTVVYYLNRKLGYATRTTANGMWEPKPEIFATPNAESGDHRDPVMSGDGMTVVFSVDDFQLRMATRSDTSAPFGASTALPFDSGDSDALLPELSHDGTRLVFTQYSNSTSETDLMIATRECLD